ncbi:MAG: hypothetical protein ACK5H2_01315 [Beutenbergiaceae bacterium]
MAGGRRRHASRALAVLATAASAVALAGCAPVTTLDPYSPSDGVRGALGNQVTINNLLLLSEAEGEPALLLAGVTNRGADTARVTLTFADGVNTTVVVPGNDTVLLDPANAAGETVIVEADLGAPGSTTAIRVSTPESGAITINTPILDGKLEPYGTYLDEYVG